MSRETNSESSIQVKSTFHGGSLSRGDLRIDGSFEGETIFVDQLQIGPKAKVKTNIDAASVIVEGLVIGNITASRRLLLYPSAKVLGDIITPELIIQDGVILEGKCIISHIKIKNTRAYIESEYERNEIE